MVARRHMGRSAERTDLAVSERWRGPRGGAPGWGPDRPWRRGPAVRLAMFVALVQVVGSTIAGKHQPTARVLDNWGYLLLLAGPLALTLRRRCRVPVAGVTIAATVAYLLLGYPYGPVLFAPVVAVIGALRAGYRTAVWILVGSAYALCVGLGRLPGVPARY